MSAVDDVVAAAQQLKTLLGDLGLVDLQSIVGIGLDLEKFIADLIASKGLNLKGAVDAADTAADAEETLKFGVPGVPGTKL